VAITLGKLGFENQDDAPPLRRQGNEAFRPPEPGDVGNREWQLHSSRGQPLDWCGGEALHVAWHRPRLVARTSRDLDHHPYTTMSAVGTGPVLSRCLNDKVHRIDTLARPPATGNTVYKYDRV